MVPDTGSATDDEEATIMRPSKPALEAEEFTVTQIQTQKPVETPPVAEPQPTCLCQYS